MFKQLLITKYHICCFFLTKYNTFFLKCHLLLLKNWFYTQVPENSSNTYTSIRTQVFFCIYTGKTQMIPRCNNGIGINTSCIMAAHLSMVWFYVLTASCLLNLHHMTKHQTMRHDNNPSDMTRL